MAKTAVVINEIGSIGLDHLLVETATGEVVLLGAGCLCCALRGDLVDTLADLAARRAQGSIPAFRRLVIETTGLADPARSARVSTRTPRPKMTTRSPISASSSAAMR